MDQLDDFVDKLQEEIFDEARQAYGEKGMQRWRNPRYQGRMPEADAHARVTGSCGDTMEIYLKFKSGRVSKASYFTDGCASSAICGSFAAELALNKDVDALTDITGDAVRAKIGRLPREDWHCADLAAATVQEALHSYLIRDRGVSKTAPGRTADRR